MRVPFFYPQPYHEGRSSMISPFFKVIPGLKDQTGSLGLDPTAKPQGTPLNCLCCWAVLRSPTKSSTFSGLNGNPTQPQRRSKKLRNRMAFGSHQGWLPLQPRRVQLPALSSAGIPTKALAFARSRQSGRNLSDAQKESDMPRS